MKLASIVIAVLITLDLEKCTPSNRIDGTFSNSPSGMAGEAFKFDSHRYTFEYFTKTEGTTTRYSSGYWTSCNRYISFSGFNDGNIKNLNVTRKIEDYASTTDDKIVVNWVRDPLDTFIKVVMVVNANWEFPIAGDTIILMKSSIKSIQLKSYLGYNGLFLRARPLIDTLYSNQFDSPASAKHKIVSLKFKVEYDDFYRTEISDSLRIKTKKTIIFHNREFKKIDE
jgi:hypothetical protein